MTMRKTLFGFVIGVVGVSAGVAFFGGYAIGRYELSPFSLVKKVERKLLGRSLQQIGAREEQPTTTIGSIFLKLSSESSSIPVSRAGNGGALTSFGDAVLLLTHEGEIFSARSANEIKETSIETPDNGFSAYERAAESERFRTLTHNLENIRYNDIHHFRTDEEQGLLLSYTEFAEKEACYSTTIAALPLDPSIQTVEQIKADKSDWDVIYRTQPCLPLKNQWRAIEGHMAGGRVAFRPPATIYLASGDYHWDGIYAPEALAQKPETDYGKVVAIDLKSRESRIVSIGHRNMQGIAFDQHDQLWVVEHGVRGGDELNRVVEGGNYGWPEETLGTLYSTLPFPNTRSYGRHDTFIAPTFAWLPSVATSGLVLIEGFHDSWDGDLLLSTLAGRSLFRIRVKDDRVLFTEKIEIGKRIRDVHQHGEDRIVLWTDDKSLIFLEVAEQSFMATFIEEYLANAGYTVVQLNQVKAALGACMECHSFEPGDHGGAPSLASIFNAPIGATGFSQYSDALRARTGQWSRSELAAFLQDPEGYASGTLMPNPGINDSFVLDELIDLLEAVSTTAE